MDNNNDPYPERFLDGDIVDEPYRLYLQSRIEIGIDMVALGCFDGGYARAARNGLDFNVRPMTLPAELAEMQAFRASMSARHVDPPRRQRPRPANHPGFASGQGVGHGGGHGGGHGAGHGGGQSDPDLERAFINAIKAQLDIVHAHKKGSGDRISLEQMKELRKVVKERGEAVAHLDKYNILVSRLLGQVEEMIRYRGLSKSIVEYMEYFRGFKQLVQKREAALNSGGNSSDEEENLPKPKGGVTFAYKEMVGEGQT